MTDNTTPGPFVPALIEAHPRLVELDWSKVDGPAIQQLGVAALAVIAEVPFGPARDAAINCLADAAAAVASEP